MEKGENVPSSYVNILVNNSARSSGKPLEEKHLRQIRDVSPKIRVREITHLVIGEAAGNRASSQELDALLAETEIIYGYAPPDNVVARAPGLKWVQCKLVGVNKFLDEALISSRVIVTNAKGMHGTSAGELVLTMMLTLTKQVPLWSRLQQEKRWQNIVPELLEGKTVGILGLGNIGRGVARMARGFNMRIVAIRSKRVTRARYADVILPPEGLHDLLTQSDFVVISLPQTPDTTCLIGAAELKAMKPTAYLINVARGGIIDEPALIRALKEKQIAGAGLDVFTKEPLPAESPLWELPNIIITSHIAGQRADYDDLAGKIFCDNLRRYLDGKKLHNIVNKRRGY
ncbi:MAG: D-2-hydroxyacid dehydrogenase [Chloroflexota bacterium]